MDHADPDSQGDPTTVVLERTIRHVEDELRGAPEEDVLARLRAAGYSEVDLQKIWSGNLLRLLTQADAYRESLATAQGK